MSPATRRKRARLMRVRNWIGWKSMRARPRRLLISPEVMDSAVVPVRAISGLLVRLALHAVHPHGRRGVLRGLRDGVAALARQVYCLRGLGDVALLHLSTHSRLDFRL